MLDSQEPALSRQPAKSKAAGRVMFFPHLKTDRKGILNAMADESIPVEDVERLRNELGGSGTPVPHEIVRYPEAGHGFGDRRY